MMAKSTNLLKETIAVLTKHGHTTESVTLVKYGRLSFTWKVFAVYAKNVEYYSGHGTAYIPLFEIIGKGWWLARTEYDGAEGWCHLEYPDIEGLRPGSIEDMEAILTIYALRDILDGANDRTIEERRIKYKAARDLRGSMGILKADTLDMMKLLLKEGEDEYSNQT